MNSRAQQRKEFERATDRLVERARDLAPAIRARSREAEELRRLPDETIRETEVFMPALVPKVWGGMGLGLRALCEVARELAHGDASTAWTVSFMMEHAWMACRLGLDVQEELFAERPYIRASATATPAGGAERVDGGFRVSGTFRYCSAVWNSHWAFVSAPAEEDGEWVPYTFLIPLEDVTVNDDWFMSGMAATSSASVTADETFIPERMSLPTQVFLSTDQHPGAEHEESFMRYPPLGTISVMIAGIALGSAEASVEVARERLAVSRAFGVPRLERPLSRVRWGTALQKVRCAQLLWRDALQRTIDTCEAGEPWSDQWLGQLELDLMTVIQLAQQALGTVGDGMGSSMYQLDDPLQRYRRDVDVIASHAFHEHDLVAERSSRFILGLGRTDADPTLAKTPSRVGAPGAGGA